MTWQRVSVEGMCCVLKAGRSEVTPCSTRELCRKPPQILRGLDLNCWSLVLRNLWLLLRFFMTPLIQLHHQVNNPRFKQLCFGQAMGFSVLGRSQCSVLSSSQPVASVTHPFPESSGTLTELVEMGHCYPLGIGLDHRGRVCVRKQRSDSQDEKELQNPRLGWL